MKLDEGEAERLFSKLSIELDDIREDRYALARREAGVVKMLDALADLYPSLAQAHEDAVAVRPDAGGGAKTIADGVEALLEELPDHWFSTMDFVHGLVERNWLPTSRDPEAAVRAALRRMYEKGLLVRQQIDGRTLQYKTDPVAWANRNPFEPAAEPRSDEPTPASGGARRITANPPRRRRLDKDER
jgi:hypothetical protein